MTLYTRWMSDQLSVFNDCRTCLNRLWNAKELLAAFPLPGWTSSDIAGEKVDEFLYRGFLAHGDPFLRQARGAYAVAYQDEDTQCLFLLRDWAGEMPLHYMMTERRVTVANSLRHLQSAEPAYEYRWVRALPHARHQIFGLPSLDPVDRVIPEPAAAYDQMTAAILERSRGSSSVERILEEATCAFRCGLEQRLQTAPSRAHVAVLLSGGLDSFAVALSLVDLGVPIKTYTLTLDPSEGDGQRAVELAQALCVEHETVRITKRQVLARFESAIRAAEIYHLYNVYCAVGIVLLADHIRQAGESAVFCGEGMNELVGDYTDWVVEQPGAGRTVLQCVPRRPLNEVSGRVQYFWGSPLETGKGNLQLGTGLAKHGVSRMVKPMLEQDITLECPYLEPGFAKRILSLNGAEIHELGGKPGLMEHLMDGAIRRRSIDRRLFRDSFKTRLQDGGATNITTLLLGAGKGQQRAIEIFNAEFKSSLDPELDARRIVRCH